MGPRRRALVVAALGMSLVIGLLAWRKLGVPRAPRTSNPISEPAVDIGRGSPPAPATIIVPEAVTSKDTQSPPSTTDPPPASLRGTDVDGDLELDANGRFVPSRQMIKLFDYFLATEGEENKDAIRERVLKLASSRVAPTDLERVRAEFDRYLAYRADVAARIRNAESGDLRSGFGILQERQRAFWGTDAERLFGPDNLLAEVSIERAALFMDPNLDEATRARRLAELEQRLPADMRAARARRQRLAGVSR